MRRGSFCGRPLGTATLSAALLLVGCTSAKRSYDGYDAASVWKAMVSVAQQPQYPDWKVVANDVWVDEPQRRIEVLRYVMRIHYQPTAFPHREEHTWRFQMRMVDEQPPKVEFVSRGFGAPTEAQAEAQRYFDNLALALMGPPGEAPQPASDHKVMDSMGLDEEAPQPAAPPPAPPQDRDGN